MVLIWGFTKNILLKGGRNVSCFLFIKSRVDKKGMENNRGKWARAIKETMEKKSSGFLMFLGV